MVESRRPKMAQTLRLSMFQSLIKPNGTQMTPPKKAIKTTIDMISSYVYIHICIYTHTHTHNFFCFGGGAFQKVPYTASWFLVVLISDFPGDGFGGPGGAWRCFF